MSGEFLIPPPSSLTAYSEDRPVLYRADGTPLKRQIGFAMQTSHTFPQLNQGSKKPPKKGGRKGC